MTTEMQTLKETAEEARSFYGTGQLTREEAKEKIQPYLNAVNEKSKELAKKHGIKHRDVSFIGFIR